MVRFSLSADFSLTFCSLLPVRMILLTFPSLSADFSLTFTSLLPVRRAHYGRSPSAHFVRTLRSNPRRVACAFWLGFDSMLVADDNDRGPSTRQQRSGKTAWWGDFFALFCCFMLMHSLFFTGVFAILRCHHSLPARFCLDVRMTGRRLVRARRCSG